MQNQKITNHVNPNHLNHQFIRKPKRKQSPKQKNDQLYQFKCIHSKNDHNNTKEEYSTYLFNQIPRDNSQKQIKNQTEIVIDLKHQLQYLKEQMAKIVTSKVQSAQIQKDSSKLKALNYYFPTKTQQNQKSLSKEVKKIKSKQRLKFSKIKKPQKFSPISPTKKSVQTQNSVCIENKDNPTQSIKQNEDNKNRRKSMDQSTLEQQIKKISQKHKKQLDNKLDSLLQQENIEKNIRKTTQSTDQKNSVHKQLKFNPAVYQVKLNKLKKHIKEQQCQIQTFKSIIKQKDLTINQLQAQLKKIQQETKKSRKSSVSKEIQTNTISKKLSEILYAKNQIQRSFIETTQQLKKIKQQNNNFKENNEILVHKLKNKQTQIIELQKQLKIQEAERQNIKSSNEIIVSALKKQFSLNDLNFEAQIFRLNSVIEELKSRQKIRIQKNSNETKRQKDRSRQKSQSTNNLQIKINQPQINLNIPSNPSPRGQPQTARQKELLNVIKLHQKSIQNYQKDLSFLEIECKNLHYCKQLCKRQEGLIREMNENIMSQQISSLNSKYLKKKSSFGGSILK